MNDSIFNSMPQGNNNMMNMVQSFIQFRNSFNGNPKEEVEKLIASGRINQQQLNQAQNMARQLQRMINGG